MEKQQKTAYLISCWDHHYTYRMNILDEYLRKSGYETTFITSDFEHRSKQTFVCSVPGCVQIHAQPYKKNLSVARIMSHRNFARDVFRYLEELPQLPDMVVAMLPPNFVGHYCAKFKKRHPDVTLIFDVFDMWPETFPSGKVKKLLAPVFHVWSWIRNHSLPAADLVTTECDLFRQMLKLPEETSATVYLCQEPLGEHESPVRLREDALDLCYLGAINNIISIPDICDLIRQLVERKPVTLHIIGKGEREQELIDGAKAAGAEVLFYGPIFDNARKQEIMSQCHFGLNIMKSSVCVGLTMKSVDYFRHGLPIINNIPADTKRLVEGMNIGVQLEDGCVDRILAMGSAEFLQLRENVGGVFKEHFSKSTVLIRLHQIMEKAIGEI